MAAESTRPIIVCPLEFERQQLERTGLTEHCDVQCSGPGSDRMARWVRTADPDGRIVILAGLAGSLHADRPAGTAWLISRVARPAPKRAFTPTFEPRSEKAPDTEIISTDLTVGRPIARRQLQLASGATLVDLESERFASAARNRGWTWAIVRGVSDDFSTVLPDEIDTWVDDAGRTRFSTVMRSLLCKPTLLPVVLELRRNSTAAMEAVDRLIRTIMSIDDAIGEPAP